MKKLSRDNEKRRKRDAKLRERERKSRRLLWNSQEKGTYRFKEHGALK